MTDSHDRNRPDDDANALDAHGFDPADYDWVPVRRQRRPDGWSPQKQRAFIEALADCGSVAQAARTVQMSTVSCYRLRRSPQGAPFAAAWDAAIQHAAKLLVDIAYDRAIHGTDEPVFDKAGNRVGRRMRQNDRLLMFLLRAHLPDRYRHAHRDARLAEEAPSLPPPLPVEQAITLLEPVTPPEPHRLMAPDALADAVEVADILSPGMLPPWLGDDQREHEEPISSLRPSFEHALALAKGEAAPDDPDDVPDDDGHDDDEDDPFLA